MYSYSHGRNEERGQGVSRAHYYIEHLLKGSITKNEYYFDHLSE